MSKIEEVARAILKARFYDCEPDMYRSLDDFWETVLPENIDDAKLDARAAIEAMRQPTTKMRAAAQGKDGYLASYKAMIDTALSEGEGR